MPVQVPAGVLPGAKPFPPLCPPQGTPSPGNVEVGLLCFAAVIPERLVPALRGLRYTCGGCTGQPRTAIHACRRREMLRSGGWEQGGVGGSKGGLLPWGCALQCPRCAISWVCAWGATTTNEVSYTLGHGRNKAMTQSCPVRSSCLDERWLLCPHGPGHVPQPPAAYFPLCNINGFSSFSIFLSSFSLWEKHHSAGRNSHTRSWPLGK